MKEGLRTESDHVPLEVVIEGEIKEGRVEEGEEIEIERSVWTEEGIEEYHKRCKGWVCNKTETEEIWKELKGKVKEARKRVKKKIIPLGNGEERVAQQRVEGEEKRGKKRDRKVEERENR